VVAAGDTPVLVDVGTFGHPGPAPTAGTTADPAAQALSASVLRTAVLTPQEIGGGADRARREERMCDPAEYEGAVLTGFRRAYDAVAAHRHELLGPVACYS